MENLPEEYAVKNKYEGAKIVEARVKDALDKAGIPDARFSAKIVAADYGSVWTTRIYAGGWLWGRRGNNKSFISSKRNQSIDMERVIEFIRGKHEETEAARKAYDAKEVKEKRSKEVADALREEMNLPEYSGRIRILGGFDENNIIVQYSDRLTPEKARELVKALQNLGIE